MAGGAQSGQVAGARRVPTLPRRAPGRGPGFTMAPSTASKAALRAAHAALLAGRPDDALQGCHDALTAEAGSVDAMLCV